MKLLRTGQVAELLGVSNMTIWRWYKAKRIKGVETPGGQLRFHPDEVNRILKQMGMPLIKTK